MRRRTLVTFLALAALIALAAIAPQTPAGRGWLLGRVSAALGGSGIHLSYQGSAGNPWRGLRLDGATVVAPGVHLTAGTVEVHYFLPALVAGELPLSVTLHGVRGSVDVKALGQAQIGGRTGLPVTPVLQELSVSDAAVTVQQVPYTIPSGAISDIRMHQHGTSVDIQAHLRTAEGSADATGVLDLNGPRFDGQVTKADVTLARHWFTGATGGTVSGPLHIGADGITGDFTLQNGSLDAIGLSPTDIHGQVQLRYPLIQANLEGTALGGPVRAQGVVNIAARHWQAHAEGTPALLSAAAWLARSDPGAHHLPLSGRAATTLDASGWTAVTITGTSDGSGAFAGLPLSDLQSDFSYDTLRGVTVQVTGKVAEGSAIVTVASGPTGTRIEGDARQLAPATGQSLDAQLQVVLSKTGARGRLHAVDHWTLPDRRATIALDAGLNGDGWQGVVQGSDGRGASLDGAVALSGNRLSGEVRTRDLLLPGLAAPITASVRADGPVSDLPLTLAIGGVEPLAVRLGPETVAADLRGNLSATLVQGRLTNLSGRLGPLAVSGDLGLAPVDGDLAIALAPTALHGPVAATLTLADGHIHVTPQGLRPSGTLSLGSVTAGPLQLTPGPLSLQSAGSEALGLTAATSDGSVTLALGRNDVHGSFSGLPLTLAHVPATVDGTVSLPLGGGALAGLQPDLTVHSGSASLTLRRTGDAIALDLAAPTGSRLGPVDMTQALSVAGTIDPLARTAALTGSLGALPVQAELTWPSSGPEAQLIAGSGASRLHAALTGTGWTLTGSMPLAPLLGAVGLPIEGTLDADLRRAGGRYAGTAKVRVTAPLSATAQLTGDGRTLGVDVASVVAGEALTARGTVLPALALAVQAGPIGPIDISGANVDGSGTLAASTLVSPLRLEPLPWTLRGTIAPLDLELSLGDGRVRLDGGQLAARLSLPLRYADQSIALRLVTAGQGPQDAWSGAALVRLGAGPASLPLAGKVVSSTGSTLLTLAGTPTALSLQGQLPAALVAAPLPSSLRPAGAIDVRGQATLARRIGYRLSATWHDGDTAPVVANLTGTAGDYRLDLQGAGLALLAQPGSLAITAHDVALAHVAAGLASDAVVNGALSLLDGTWNGALHARATLPTAVAVDVTGNGVGLDAHVTGALGPVRATIDGAVLPAPRLHAVLQAWSGAATLVADADGSWSAPAVAGTLTTEPLSAGAWLAVAARKVSLSWTPASGSLSATGDGIDLTGSLADLHGTVALPVQALGADGVLTADVSGPVATARVQATLTGAAVHGRIAGDAAHGLQADLVARATALRPLLGPAAALLASDATLGGHIAIDGGWNARLDTALAVRGHDLPVRVDLDGTGLRYAGSAVLDASSTPPATAALVRAAIHGEGVHLASGIDLATIDFTRLGDLLGVPLELGAAGSLALTTVPFSAALKVQASGTVAGRDLALSGHVGSGSGVDLGATFDGVTTDLHGAAGTPLSLTVATADGSVALHGSLVTSPQPHGTLAGTFRGATVSADGKADLSSGRGSLHARLGAASLDAELAPADAASALALQVSAPPGSLAPLGSSLAGAIQAQLTLGHGSATIERLSVSNTGGPVPLRLALSGPAYPVADLTGTLAAPDWKAEAGVTLRGPPGSLQLDARLGGLRISAQTQGTGLERLTLDGSTDLAILPHPITFDASTLSWSPATGFSGQAQLETAGSLVGLPGTLRAHATGEGTLALTASAGPATSPWVRGEGALASDPLRDPRLQGTVTFDLPLSQLAGLPADAPLHLVGTPSLSGVLTDPVLEGPVAMQGALAAHGSVLLRRGQGALDLKGADVSLTAQLKNGAWNGFLGLTDVPLAPFDPRLHDASLSLSADVTGGGGEQLRANVSSLRLGLPGATLTGTAALGEGVRVALQVQADLSAMPLPGPPLQGLVHGPLVLVAPSLADLGHGTVVAVLDVANVGAAGMGGTVAGTLQVGGTADNPVLSSTLQGSGEIHGQLRLDAAPARGQLDVHSTLSYRGLSTDLGVVLQDGHVQASGDARMGRAEIVLSASSSGALDLTGTKALQGWRATVGADLGHAHLEGPLASLGVGATGELALDLGGRPRLQGQVRNAALAGIDLGTLSLTSASPGATIGLSGPQLRATFRPDTLGWDATLDHLPLRYGAYASGTAQGAGARGRAALSLTGSLAGAPVGLSLEASNQSGLTVSANGRVLGGTIAVRAEQPAGGDWVGTARLTGADLSGIQVSLDGTVSGHPQKPALDGSLTLRGAVQGNARLHASLAGASVEAALAGAAIGGSLRVAGAVAPTPDLTVSAAGPAGPTHGSVRLFVAGGALRADGNVSVRSGPVSLDVRGSGRDTPIAIGLRLVALPGLAFHAELPTERPAALIRTLTSDGLGMTGAGRTRGHLTLKLLPEPEAVLGDVRLQLGGTTFSATGSVGPQGGRLDGSLTLPSQLPVDAVGGGSMPYQAALQNGRLTLDSSGNLGSVRVDLDTRTGTGHATAQLHTLGGPSGTAALDLNFDPSGGPSGQLSLHGIRLSRAGLPALQLGADVQIGGGRITGTADAEAAKGGVHVQGSWGLGGWLPPSLAPNAPHGGTAEARVRTFQLALLPTVQRLAPHLTGAVSGIVNLHDDAVVAQLLAPDLAVAGTALPLDAQVTGPWSDLSAHLRLGNSVVTGTFQGAEAKGLIDFRRFPAQVLAEASAGTTDIKADVDGVLRFDVPLRDPAASYIRMATEAIRLERADVVTTGNVAWVYDDGAFSIEQASFEGRGSWQAQGSVTATKLDLTLSAQSADFGPLLGLVPRFARYGVGASGSFTLRAQGSLAEPDVTLTANNLEAQVAGTHYRIGRADAQLQGSALTASAHVVGVAPLGGSLDAHGSAQLMLAPLALRNADFRFTGSAELPVLGTITQISGGITQPPGSVPQLAVSGRLGSPFTIRGSLAPFDLTIRGQGLDLRALPLFVTSSSVNTAVRLQGTDRGLAVSGELDASEIHMDLGASASPTPSSTATSPSTPSSAAGSGSESTGAGSKATPAQGTRAALQAVIFDQLHLKAPQRVQLDASFGSAEAALDLTLTGTAAAPQLSGTASALRGSLKFAGRDFTIDRAVATFQQGRGVYPTLDVEAHTTFDKRRVLAGTSGVTFAAPPDSSSFDVTLAFNGQVQQAVQGPSPVSFDISPTLTSNATVQVGTDTTTSSPRPLTDQELLSLITLGRLEVKPQLAGQAGIGTAVAQSAIDTAVDVLVVNELQNALSKALGLDVVEIHTSPLSSLLDNNGQPFGVSLRLGGYLTPELFASYRLGNVTSTGQTYAFTNEVTLTYDLGPLNVDLSGSLSFPDATATPTGPVPELGVSLRYAFTSSLGLEAGVDLSDVRKQAHFGVSLRW